MLKRKGGSQSPIVDVVTDLTPVVSLGSCEQAAHKMVALIFAFGLPLPWRIMWLCAAGASMLQHPMGSQCSIPWDPSAASPWGAWRAESKWPAGMTCTLRELVRANP